MFFYASFLSVAILCLFNSSITGLTEFPEIKHHVKKNIYNLSANIYGISPKKYLEKQTDRLMQLLGENLPTSNVGGLNSVIWPRKTLIDNDS